jgi:peptidoglycan/LPS O-acetylase OafA/YrhL
MPDGIRVAVDPISVPQATAATTRKRIPTLDGLRAVSIVLVLLNHLVGTLYYPAILSPLGEFGNFGVRVFFLSPGT